jgi:hypothetical protein
LKLKNGFSKNFDFRRQYRLTKGGVLKLVDKIQDDLQFPDKRGSPLSPLQQTCLALIFFSAGTFQRIAGQIAGVKKSCACLTLRRVITSICRLAPTTIQLPSRSEMRRTSDNFMDKYGLPNFAMGVDGTHIMLGVRPTQRELPAGLEVQDFWCRKQFYSLNCQIIGNDTKMILNVVARWAGCTHDARVWSNCNAKSRIEEQNDFFITGY